MNKIFFFIAFIAQFTAYSQNSQRKFPKYLGPQTDSPFTFNGSINVYIKPFGRNPVAATNITPNEIRIGAPVKIVITDGSVKNQLYWAVKLLKRTAIKDTQGVFFNCKLVIDFVKDNDIISSIAIDDHLEICINDNGRQQIALELYKRDLDFICYLKSLFPYFIQSIPGTIKCDEFPYLYNREN